MLRRASSFAVGDWDSTNPGLTIRTGLAGQLRYIPSRFPALPPCYFPLGVSSPGRTVALEGLLLSTFCLSEAISRMPKRRTIANHVLLQRPASDVGLGEFYGIDVRCCCHNRDQFRRRWLGFRCVRLPVLSPPGRQARFSIGVFFRCRRANLPTQATDEGTLQGE